MWRRRIQCEDNQRWNSFVAKKFYGGILGFEEGRSSKSWQVSDVVENQLIIGFLVVTLLGALQDYSMLGHQLVCHEVSPDYRGQDHYNPVGMTDSEISQLA